MADADLVELRRQVVELRAAVSSLARHAPPAPLRPSTRRSVSNVTNVTNTSTPFVRFSPEEEVALVEEAATGSTSGTVELSGSVPAGARCAYVRFDGYCEGADVGLTLETRPSGGSALTRVLRIYRMDDAGDTASNTNSEWVCLSNGQAFDYVATVTSATATWSITLLGYY